MDMRSLIGAGMGDVTAETLEAVRKVLGNEPMKYIPGYGIIQKDITTSTGLNAYNLEPAAKLLVPAITPLRNMIPRIGNTRGGTRSEFRVINSIDIARSDVFTAEGTKAGTISYSVTPRYATFATISKGDNFTFQSQWAGLGFEDVRARGIARLLRHVLIHEEQAILGGNITEMGTASVALTAPTTALVASGSLTDGAYRIKYRAVTNLGRGKLSAAGTSRTTATTNNSVSATWAWVEGAVRYDIYADVAAGGTYKYQGTTQINSYLLGASADYNAAGAAAPADDSADTKAYDGIISQLPATAATVTTLAAGTAGTGTQLALSDIDGAFRTAWDTYRSNPDVLVVNSEQSTRITNLVLAASGAPTLFVQNNANEKAELVGGYRVSHYINKATGKNVPILTHPYLHAGTVMALTFDMPFPASDIINPIEIETRQEYLQLDYPIVAPKWEYEVLVDSTLKMFFPGSCVVIRNIAPGV